MKVGIGTYTLTWSIGVPGYVTPAHPLDAQELLRIAKENGMSVVQFADNLPLHKMSPAELGAIQVTAGELGISLEVGTRGTDPAHMLSYLQIAEALGAPLVRTLITEKDLHAARQHIRRILPSYEKAGVCIAIENHGLHTTGQLSALFQEINHPLVGCCLDTVNSFGALDCPATVIRDLVPFIVNLHIKDFDIKRVDHQMGFTVLGTPAGAGRLDIPALLETIRRHGKSPHAILELWTPFTNSMEETVKLEQEWFRQSVDYLKKLNFTI